MHPDKKCTNPTEHLKEETEHKFCKLQRAKDILGDENKRRDYDRWRQSGLHFSYRKWCQLNEQGGLHTSIHWFGSRDRKHALMDCEGENQSLKTGAQDDTADINMNSTQNDVSTTPFTERGTSFEKDFRQSNKQACSLLRQFRNYEI